MQLIQLRLGCSQSQQIPQAPAGQKVRSSKIHKKTGELAVLDAGAEEPTGILDLGDDPFDALVVPARFIHSLQHTPQLGHR
jgi:hypothetical protein